MASFAQKTIFHNTLLGQHYGGSPGSESMACNESSRVNVGYPSRSQMDLSIGEQASKTRTPRHLLGGQMRHSTDEAE